MTEHQGRIYHRIRDFEIQDLGMEHDQYFQGVGTAFTPWDDVAVGVGFDAKEAYEDAVEQLAQRGYEVDHLPTRPRGIRKRDHVPAGDAYEEWHWRVAIFVETSDEIDITLPSLHSRKRR